MSGNGLHSRDFIHVFDVVEANPLAMQHPMAAGRISMLVEEKLLYLWTFWIFLTI
ncbi:MAG: hypothetical protein DCF20_00815 [Pseudanabaena sp.]|nr:MAG: hypothetical protein DCF20_00815 [Pseudanabaena sp.]